MAAEDLQAKIAQTLDAEKARLDRELLRPNVLVAGGTGVGKSTLVNTVFGSNTAVVGAGKPVTKLLRRHESDSVPVVLFDTVGYEVDSDLRPEGVEELIEFAAGRDVDDAGERIHVAWYLIDASRARVLGLDTELCARLRAEDIPVAVVLTKCDVVSREDLAALRDAVLVATNPTTPVFAVTSRNLPGIGHVDLDALCAWTSKALPAARRTAFVKAQRVNLSSKNDLALEIIAQHAAGNAFVGWVPIPFSDAPMLVTSQATMISRLLSLWGVNDDGKSAAYKLLAGPLVSQAAIMGIGQIVKLLPGLGTFAGGLINATVAGAITGVMGSIVNGTCKKAWDLALSGRTADLEAYLNAGGELPSRKLIEETLLSGVHGATTERSTR